MLDPKFEPLVLRIADTSATLSIEDNEDSTGQRPVCMTMRYDDSNDLVCVGLTPEEACQVILKLYELISHKNKETSNV